MVNGLGQYPYNNYPNYPYNQQAPGNFNGDPAAIPIDQVKGSPLGQKAADINPADPKSVLAKLPYIGASILGCLGIKKAIDPLCVGKFEESKLYQWTKNIDDKLKGTFVERLDNRINNAGNRIKQFFARTPLKDVAAKFETGSSPKSGFARMSIGGMKVQGVDELLDTLGRKGVVEQLDNFGDLKDKVADITKLFKSGSKNAYDAFDELNDAFKATGKLDDLMKIPKLSKAFNKAQALVLNKARAQAGQVGKTFLSRLLPKSILTVGDSLSGAVVGNTFGLLMNAFFLADTLKKTAEAPKGEKLSTFMEEFWANMIGQFIFMPVVSEKFLYKLTGWGNLGFDRKISELAQKSPKLANKMAQLAAKHGVADVAQGTVQEGIEALQKGLANTTDEVARKAIKKHMKSLSKLTNKVAWYEKPFKYLGKILTTGLNPKAWSGKLMNKLRGLGGGALRFALIMFVLVPPITNLFAKFSHKVFGKPTNSQYDTDKKKDETANKPTNADPNKPSQNQQMNAFLDQTRNRGQVANQPQQISNQPQQTVNQPVSSQPVNNQPANNQSQQRTYIPSATPANFTAANMSSIDSALAKSDRMMEYADKVLKEVS